MTTASSPNSISSSRSSRVRPYSSWASTRSTSGASCASCRATKVSEAVSNQMPLAWHLTVDLVDLLERRAVDPVDQRLGGAADRAEVDRVEAPLVGVRARLVAPVDLGPRHLDRGGERTPQHAPAALE